MAFDQKNIEDLVYQIFMPENKQRNDILIDTINDEQYITIYAEAPCVNKEDMKIDVFNNKLTITVDKKCPYTEITTSEIKYGKFVRVITLPICVTKKETVAVQYKNGMICIKINKYIEEENRFNIQVNDN